MGDIEASASRIVELKPVLFGPGNWKTAFFYGGLQRLKATPSSETIWDVIMAITESFDMLSEHIHHLTVKGYFDIIAAMP